MRQLEQDRQSALERAVAYSVAEANILPITSRCEGGCVFCSHKNNLKSVRVFMPAFSSFAPKDVFPDADRIYDELKAFLSELSEDLPCPVLLEPSWVKDLDAVLSGVRRDSPAWRAGLRRGDRLLTVNGRAPWSRVEAFSLLSAPGRIAVTYSRGGAELSASWVNEGLDHGVTMEYDYDPARADYTRRVVEACPGKSVLLCSEFAFAVLGEVLKKLELPPEKAELHMVKNRTFGGTVRAAGLLTVDDYLSAFGELNEPPMQLLVPGESFDAEGYDLTGRHFSELHRRTGVHIVVT